MALASRVVESDDLKGDNHCSMSWNRGWPPSDGDHPYFEQVKAYTWGDTHQGIKFTLVQEGAPARSRTGGAV